METEMKKQREKRGEMSENDHEKRFPALSHSVSLKKTKHTDKKWFTL